MNALELSQLAANYATVANLGAAVAMLVMAAVTYLATFGAPDKKKFGHFHYDYFRRIFQADSWKAGR